MPGEEDPKILIRAMSSWNNAEPLVLVDGIERPMSSVDISSVESISVLKDASATAVYGVRGANGVILINHY
jgi:TonB-dependent SusC/RagA subfamily outer membrane receptor